MRYFLRLAYNGSPFHGWQRQPNASSVQETIEESLSTILRTPTPITGAGRTDTGVHAACMYAHFDTLSPLADPEATARALNRMCGRDIAIREIIPVHSEAHARFDAKMRTYKYFVLFSKSPFFRNMSWLSPSGLDIKRMNEAAEILTHTSDFTSFAKLHSDAKTNICKVSEALWTLLEGFPGVVFTISADRFLRNMVRAVVGTLVDVGRGKLSLEEFAAVIEKKDRCAAGTSMPPEALFLWDIRYPYINPQNP
ncbi:MAG: tRNA pseudouridine(38-40) synthase TruA [Bacteroidales bacterium]|nr:tRNA pseudouridine(38-40) synthase TruA [Bacteroidales bacterium]